ncbi:MAG: 3-deoxy-7-phosphoheptulonate synthase [Oscillospiraceae bacterium]|jgi:3-deoxy-7-phosphoheptulonate synthase|nr:3-deoxy-7-phosphoheptulonate synthase [Oscillospiraceae bacterium]
MIVILKQNHDPKQLDELRAWLEEQNVAIQANYGVHSTVLGLIGDTAAIDSDLIEALDIVETVKRVSEPYKKANRKFHPENSVIPVGVTTVGGLDFAVMAGPCSVENREQLCEVAHAVKAGGATILRGGAFKPRTSPYAFQGMRESGIDLLLEAKKQTGLPIVTEIMDISHLDAFADVDCIQVGARNMQNFELLKELGHCNTPILLKRGLSSTIQEWLMSAEYIMAGGNENVILCERGIRTFETATRNTLDLSAVPVIKELSHLPIIIDPSHATGISRYVKPLAIAAAAIGADGIMTEVHNNPAKAMCDGPQSLTPAQFAEMMREIQAIVAVRR